MSVRKNNYYNIQIQNLDLCCLLFKRENIILHENNSRIDIIELKNFIFEENFFLIASY